MGPNEQNPTTKGWTSPPAGAPNTTFTSGDAAWDHYLSNKSDNFTKTLFHELCAHTSLGEEQFVTEALTPGFNTILDSQGAAAPPPK
jgi:hypothetical protein